MHENKGMNFATAFDNLVGFTQSCMRGIKKINAKSPESFHLVYIILASVQAPQKKDNAKSDWRAECESKQEKGGDQHSIETKTTTTAEILL